MSWRRTSSATPQRNAARLSGPCKRTLAGHSAAACRAPPGTITTRSAGRASCVRLAAAESPDQSEEEARSSGCSHVCIAAMRVPELRVRVVTLRGAPGGLPSCELFDRRSLLCRRSSIFRLSTWPALRAEGGHVETVQPARREVRVRRDTRSPSAPALACPARSDLRDRTPDPPRRSLAAPGSGVKVAFS